MLFAIEYYGVTNVPERGAVIIAANHPSYLDPVLVGTPIKRKIRFIAWEALFQVPVLGWIIRVLGAFPVKGENGAGYDEARRILLEGGILGIFPEGKRSEYGQLGELRTGTARLAVETGALIIPVTICGAWRAWPKWKLLPKPAKIIVRFHPPIILDKDERLRRRDDQEYYYEIMRRVATQINQSLQPALRWAEAREQWYRQPPAHLRTYEWVPFIVALVTTLLTVRRGLLIADWMKIWLPVVGYFTYIACDRSIIRPSRIAKWVRNSMPIWLILIWHFPLTESLVIPAGELNGWLILATLTIFSRFFYEGYRTLQKFVRGLVIVYYAGLAIALNLPHQMGLFVATLSFMVISSFWFRIAFRWLIVVPLSLLLVIGVWQSDTASMRLFIYLALAICTLAYLRAFPGFAYDIRRSKISLHLANRRSQSRRLP